MKQVLQAVAVTALLLSVWQQNVVANEQRPNIVFMLADDQGWNETSVQMHPEIPDSKSDFCQTPWLEKLASQGMRFSAAYAPAPKCAPTRLSLQTGMSPAQNHMTYGSRSVTAADGYRLIPPQDIRNISDDVTTIAEVLRKAGYATAHYGKWHIGGGGPGRHGYDEHDGDIGNEYAFKFADPNPVDIFGMAERAEAFMEKHSEEGKPFFIQMSWHALHAPHNAMKATLEKYQNLPAGRLHRDPQRAAINENLDEGVGRVMQAIERLGIGDNTFLIYMSDNGGSGRKGGPLAGGKSVVLEGGIRIPLIVRGPGVQGNSWCHTPVVGYDFFPTFCEWAEAMGLPSTIEGGSIVSLLNGTGEAVNRPRDELVFYFPHYHSADGPHAAIRSGDLKLIRFYETDKSALFDLSKDIGERNDLASSMPDDVKRLNQQLTAYLNAVGASLPRLNPDHDPTKTAQSLRDDKRQRRDNKSSDRKGGGKKQGKKRSPKGDAQ